VPEERSAELLSLDDELKKRRKSRTVWLGASVKLTCGCNLTIPTEQYFDFWPGLEMTCSTHGDTVVLRVSRVGKS